MRNNQKVSYGQNKLQGVFFCFVFGFFGLFFVVVATGEALPAEHNRDGLCYSLFLFLSGEPCAFSVVTISQMISTDILSGLLPLD